MPRRLETNAPGPLYVNDACIDCDTCRQLAPSTFAEVADYSAVVEQPESEAEWKAALYALLACPTAAIKSEVKEGLKDRVDDFPLQIEDDVYYCGFTSERSFGGSSYFIQHPEGNWLVDSPRYVPTLAEKLKKLGGVRYIFLTHRDDIADAAKYAEYFQAARIIHILEKRAQPEAEEWIQGYEPVEWSNDFVIIPVPGHTAGHIALLYKNKFLFTGDHLAWSRNRKCLTAFKSYCWYSWDEQLKSLERLLQYSFEWVLPGHGQRIRLEQNEMKSQLMQLIKS